MSYATLLDEFWAAHDPTAPSWSRQYMSAIWAQDDAQLAQARESRDRVEAVAGRPVLTEIRILETFHDAEDHHQKYYLRADGGLMDEFREMYPDFRDVVASTAAARVNGILGGAGCLADLVDEIGSYGLSRRETERLAACRGRGFRGSIAGCEG